MTDHNNQNQLQRKHDEFSAHLSSAERGIVWTIWLTYGAFYFCRTNIAVALPGIEAEFGYDATKMGMVLASLKIAYGCGQLLNGQLAEQFRPRVMLAIGLFASATLNVIFGFGTGFYFFLFVWACNGYCQSLGWTPCMRVIRNWIPIARRGKAVGIIGTGYQLAGALSFIVSGAAVSWFGWRGAFFLPPAILVVSAIVMLVFLKETPEGNSKDDRRQFIQKNPSINRGKMKENFLLTISNRSLWFLAISLGLLNACRYGYTDWGISHLVKIEQEKLELLDNQSLKKREHSIINNAVDDGKNNAPQDETKKSSKKKKGGTKKGSVLKAAIKFAILPIGGILGSLIAGWVTDRFFGGRRAPVICTLLVALGVMTLMYDYVARTSFVGTIILLLFIGFAIYGPQVLLVGTAPADLAHKGTAAAAAGFVNFFGYIGAAIIGDIVTGYVVDHYSWEMAITLWAGWAFGAAILVAVLWNTTGHNKTQQA